MTKGEGFTTGATGAAARDDGETLRGLMPRYRALAARGQIELSATPDTIRWRRCCWISPRRAKPSPTCALPQAHFYPGGRARVDRHIALARDSHARRFGQAPAGMWPAEGALSDALRSATCRPGLPLGCLQPGVLANSLRRDNVAAPVSRYRPWRLAAAPGTDAVLPRRAALRPDRLRVRQVARPRRRPPFRRPAGAHPRRRAGRRDAAGVRDPRRRKRLGALPLQRLLLLRGPLRPARCPALAPPPPPSPTGWCAGRDRRPLPAWWPAAGCTAPSPPGSASRTRTAPGTCSARQAGV
jgi:hypothetical protein